jgi:hypothetical protein
MGFCMPNRDICMTDLSPEKYFGIWRIKADSCDSLEAARYHFLPSLDLVLVTVTEY